MPLSKPPPASSILSYENLVHAIAGACVSYKRILILLYV
jgi:hypothetical protein